MRKAAAIVVVLGVLGASIGLWAVSSTADESGRTIKLIDKDTSFDFLDLGEKGESVGDQFSFVGDLFKAEKGNKAGKKLGHVAGTCTVVSIDQKAEELLCHAGWVLKEGQIFGSGVITFAGEGPHTFTVPITGGTGAFRKARGEAVIDEISEEVSIDSIRLS